MYDAPYDPLTPCPGVTDDETGAECGFTDQVQADLSGSDDDYVADWTCPQCGTKRREERGR